MDLQSKIILISGPTASGKSGFAVNLARKINLGINAGHDLDLHNLAYFLENVPADEVSIGHALISDSLVMGIENTVKKYLDLCN